MLKNYTELKVWQKAYQLCLEIYKVTKNFPREERYGLTAQIRRAAVSIPSDIAEGYGRRTPGEYIQSLYIAYGSICELETQILSKYARIPPSSAGGMNGLPSPLGGKG
jgi:four helix bundle protein